MKENALALQDVDDCAIDNLLSRVFLTGEGEGGLKRYSIRLQISVLGKEYILIRCN